MEHCSNAAVDVVEHREYLQGGESGLHMPGHFAR